MANGNIITRDLGRNFQAAIQGLPLDKRDFAPDIASVRDTAFAEGQAAAAHVIRSRGTQNSFASSGVSNTGLGMAKMASGGIVYTQPQFFSPIHTPINWQIPVKRKEQYQWARYYYENEPKVATAVEFYSKFPINGFTNECSNRYVKHFFDKLSDKLHLLKWLRVMSHEVHLLGDCFPFLEVDCDKCRGTGVDSGGTPCEHENGSFKRLVILNPECAEVYSDPISPESLIAFLPNDELRTLIMKRGPGHEKFSKDIVKMIMAGIPIPLDNRNVTHIKYCDNGYNKYGIGMVRRLFPILAYKTKLMTAQWIIAERLILPIKVAKVGSDERPASAGDLADINTKLAQVANDPNLTLVTHHAFELDWFGASGKIMQLTNEFEIISQEILDGLGVNKVLLNGEGPCFHPDVEILTEEGWKNYEDVNDGEKIGTFNQKTNGLEYQDFKNRIVRDYDGDLVHFVCESGDLDTTETLVTTNHRMWAQDPSNSEWSVIPAEEVGLGMTFRTAPDDWPNQNEVGFTMVIEAQRVPYKGKVWCFEVPNEFLVVRMHGKPLIAGNTYNSAAIGVEVMIDKLDAWRNELSEWVEQKVYLQVAKMMGFIEKNEWGEYEYVYPRLKWNIMHLRDQQQMRTFMLQLHEKGTISTQTMLKAFDIDYDQEVELLRYERAKGAAAGGQQQGGMGSGFGGGGGGGMPDLGALGGEGGGGGDMGGPEMGGAPGGDMGGGSPGGDMGGGGMGAAAASSVANIREFGGKVLKKKSREKISKYKDHLFRSKQKQDEASGYMRDDKGRIQFTGPERELLKELAASVKRGEIRHNLQAQFPVQTMGEEYTIDFAMPDIKLGIEVDGALFHSTDDQIASDKKRDSKLAQLGWTILRFTDKEVENKPRQIIETIIKNQLKKENWLKSVR